MVFDGIVKGVSISGYVPTIERRPKGAGYELVEHIFVLLKSGGIVDIQPQKKVVHTVYGSKYSNAYPKMAYAWGNNRFYFHAGQEQNSVFIEYDPVTLTVSNVFDSLNFNPYHNSLYGQSNIRVADFNNFQVSTDGHVYLNFFRTDALPCMLRYNSLTDQFDVANQIPDLEAEIMQGRNLQLGYHYTEATTALQGVYAGYLFSDNLDPLFDTIISEATTAGVTFAGKFLFKLHTDDRAISSTKRRIAGACNISGVDSADVYVQRVLDLKNTSDRYDIGFDETGALVWPVAVGVTDTLSNLSGVTGIADPIFHFGNCYSGGRHAGRFFYYSSYFSGNTRNIGFPYALQDYPGFGIEKGQVIFPQNRTWDRQTELPNNAGTLAGVYKCNFSGIQGFSASDEYVAFFYDHSDGTTVGYLRPDNLEFAAYDPVADPSGFVIAPINSQSEILAEFDCITGEISGANIEIGEENAISIEFLQSAILEDIVLDIDENGHNTVDVAFEVAPDKTQEAFYQGMAYRLPAVTNDVASVIELDTNQLFVAGMLYAGVFGKTRSGGNLTDLVTFTNGLSIYHSFRFDNATAVYLGYPNEVAVVKNTPSYEAHHTNVKQGLYGCNFNGNYAIVSGINLRVKDYYEIYAHVLYFNPNTGASVHLPNTPNTIDPFSGKTFRDALMLKENNYSDSDVNNAVESYAAANSLNRSQVINMALDTCLYRSFEPVAWDSTKCLVSLERRPIAGLRGIRINDNADGSGTWYDENEGLSTAWPSAYYFEKPDPTTLVEADYKTIEFQVAGFQGVTTLGRLAESTDYVAFLKNENASGNASIRVVTKAAIESAAATGNPITAFDKILNIPLGSTSSSYGFGPGEAGYGFLNISYKPNQCFFTAGNDLYVSVITSVTDGGSKPAIYKVDLSAGTITVWARLAIDRNKALNYNPETDRCFVSVASDHNNITGTFYVIDNFSSVGAPYDIT